MAPTDDDPSERPERTQAWATEEVDPAELERVIRESDRLRKAVRGEGPSESARARKPTARDPAVEADAAGERAAETDAAGERAVETDAADERAVDPGALTEELPPNPGAATLSREQTRELVRRRGQGLRPGTVLGKRFRLDEEVGRGAQGIVYRARDLALAREVAVKLLRTDAPGQARERFQREAKTISRLRHPGIVTVYETGATDDGTLFYAMELVSGRSLEDLLDEEGYLEPQRLVKILEAVALAIHHAHDAGLIHRDLKPGNLLLDADEERPRIADFGLVSLGDATRLTMTRGVVGTPVYMAPEQAEGAKVDRRADVYSLGAILYEGLVGQPPFSGVTPLEIFRKVVEEDPTPPSDIRGGIPPLVERVCLRALEKEPRARYPTAAAFGRDLRRALDGQRLAPEAPVRIVRRRLRRRRGRATGALVVGALGALLGLLAGWGLGRRVPAPGRQPLRAQLGDLPDPDRAAKRERVLGAAREERARCLPGAALAWLDTVAEESLVDPLAARDVARARALGALAQLDLGQVERGAQAAQAAAELAPGDPLVKVALAAVAGPQGRARLRQVLASEPGLIEGWLALGGSGGDVEARLQALDTAVALSEPRPWPLALRRRAWLLLELGRLDDARADVARVLDRVGTRQGFEVERALALWGEDPTRSLALLEAQRDGPQGAAAQSALAALPATRAAASGGETSVGQRLRVTRRRQSTRRLMVTTAGGVAERTEVETVLARHVDRVLGVKAGRAARVERTYEELRISSGAAVWVTDLVVVLGPQGLETALAETLDGQIREVIERDAWRFARWGLPGPPPTPTEAGDWDAPLELLAELCGVSASDMTSDAPAARGRLVERGPDSLTVELVGALRLARFQGLACSSPATGLVRCTRTYEGGFAQPAKAVLEGSYAGEAGWPWAGVALAFEVAVEGDTSISEVR
jgi:tRNA A-37 threonylcarbamoyl transferase component Bud32